jgi:hypothetical protein
MKRLIGIMTPMIILSALPCHAQAVSDNLFSLDLSYSLTGLKNHGWGIGLNFEKKFLDNLSAKANFGHMTFLTGIEDVYNTSVSISLFTNYYPFSNGLDKLYIGVGNGCDFMNYFGDGELPHTTKDTLIHITPQVGWKFQIFNFLMIDLSSGYKFLIMDTQNYRDIKDYVNAGLNFGINIMILLNGIRKENGND